MPGVARVDMSAMSGLDAPMTDELIQPAEAADMLGVSVGTLRRWESEGKISAVKTLGGQRRFVRADIEALRSAA